MDALPWQILQHKTHLLHLRLAKVACAHEYVVCWHRMVLSGNKYYRVCMFDSNSPPPIPNLPLHPNYFNTLYPPPNTLSTPTISIHCIHPPTPSPPQPFQYTISNSQHPLHPNHFNTLYPTPNTLSTPTISIHYIHLPTPSPPQLFQYTISIPPTPSPTQTFQYIISSPNTLSNPFQYIISTPQHPLYPNHFNTL